LIDLPNPTQQPAGFHLDIQFCHSKFSLGCSILATISSLTYILVNSNWWFHKKKRKKNNLFSYLTIFLIRLISWNNDTWKRFLFLFWPSCKSPVDFDIHSDKYPSGIVPFRPLPPWLISCILHAVVVGSEDCMWSSNFYALENWVTRDWMQPC